MSRLIWEYTACLQVAFEEKAGKKKESDDKKLEYNDQKTELFFSVCLQMHLFPKK